MEKITNIEDLRGYLKDNIEDGALFKIENAEQDPNAFENFQEGFESGYANAYANLLSLIDEEFATEWKQRNSDHKEETSA